MTGPDSDEGVVVAAVVGESSTVVGGAVGVITVDDGSAKVVTVLDDEPGVTVGATVV